MSNQNNEHKNNEEYQYLNLMREILDTGTLHKNRTGIDTLTLWGKSLQFDLSESFPLFTTKKVFFKGMIAELLFFISGKTDSKILEKQGINIWKGNTTRQFLDSAGLKDYNEGELGPLYPWQWRHYGAEYIPNKQLEIGQGGFDQLQYIIDTIKDVKNNPFNPKSRRLIMNSWNVLDLDKMCLAPCHYCIQFSVDNDRLNGLVTMRSSDIFLGLPWNINYAALIYMICHLTDLKPGKLVYSLADVHVYSNVIDQVKLQISRVPKKFPKLEIIGKHQSINDFTLDSFKLIDYDPYPAIKADMAV